MDIVNVTVHLSDQYFACLRPKLPEIVKLFRIFLTIYLNDFKGAQEIYTSKHTWGMKSAGIAYEVSDYQNRSHLSPKIAPPPHAEKCSSF